MEKKKTAESRVYNGVSVYDLPTEMIRLFHHVKCSGIPISSPLPRNFIKPCSGILKNPVSISSGIIQEFLGEKIRNI